MAKNYNVSTIDEVAARDIVGTWRAENPWRSNFGLALSAQRDRRYGQNRLLNVVG